jgi:hypothetical protein
VHVHNARVTGQVADSVELDGQAYGIAGVRAVRCLIRRASHQAGRDQYQYGLLAWPHLLVPGRGQLAASGQACGGLGHQGRGRKLGAGDRLFGVRVRADDSETRPGCEVSAIDLPGRSPAGCCWGRRFIRAAYVHMDFHRRLDVP